MLWLDYRRGGEKAGSNPDPGKVSSSTKDRVNSVVGVRIHRKGGAVVVTFDGH